VSTDTPVGDLAEHLRDDFTHALADGHTRADIEAAVDEALTHAPTAALTTAADLEDAVVGRAGVTHADTPERVVDADGVTLTLTLNISERDCSETDHADAGTPGESDESDGSDDAPADDPEPFTCQQCGREFETIQSRTAHQNSPHSTCDPASATSDSPAERAARVVTNGTVETVTELADELDVTPGTARNYARSADVYSDLDEERSPMGVSE
jgi:hypothetical protein